VLALVWCLRWLCVTPQHAAAAEASVRVITYNVAGGFVSDDVPLAVILPQRPDLVLLQEVRNTDHLARLAQDLHLPYWRFAPYSRRRGGVAILSRWPLGTAHRLPWRQSPQGKLALAAPVYSPAGRFWACSAHLDNPFALHYPLNLGQRARLVWHEIFATTQRTQQAMELSAWLLRLGGENTIIGGDFNSLPWTGADRHLRHYFADALSGSLRQYVRGTYWGWPHIPIRLRVDFLYHASNWQVVEAQVIQHKASDHFPVLAVFSPPVKERGAAVAPHDEESLAGSVLSQF
jgi:endonuclease/exonuclease/phosphatase (EEP) superfamily protein YafD